MLRSFVAVLDALSVPLKNCAWHVKNRYRSHNMSSTSTPCDVNKSLPTVQLSTSAPLSSPSNGRCSDERLVQTSAEAPGATSPISTAIVIPITTTTTVTSAVIDAEDTGGGGGRHEITPQPPNDVGNKGVADNENGLNVISNASAKTSRSTSGAQWHAPCLNLIQTASQSSLFVTLGEDWYSRLDDFGYRTKMLILRYICPWIPLLSVCSLISVVMFACISSGVPHVKHEMAEQYQSPYTSMSMVASPPPPNLHQDSTPVLYTSSSSSPLLDWYSRNRARTSIGSGSSNSASSQRRLFSNFDFPVSFHVAPASFQSSFFKRVWNKYVVSSFGEPQNLYLRYHQQLEDTPEDDSIPPVSFVKAPVSKDSVVRQTYAKLAREYLAPFKKTRIARALLIDQFLHRTGTCGACVLIQVRRGHVYVYDPRGVRTTMSFFRELRLREGIAWIQSAVQRRVVDNFELILSMMDNPATTCHSHNYRLPQPLQNHATNSAAATSVSRKKQDTTKNKNYKARKTNDDVILSPIFNAVFCNVSTNIPFPIMISDALRRASPHLQAVLNDSKNGTLAKPLPWPTPSPLTLLTNGSLLGMWDATMWTLANGNSTLQRRWSQKKRKGVFRGAVRISASIKHVSDFKRMCDVYGRTALYAKAKEHPHELDVQLDGTCGNRIYVSNNLLNAARTSMFKYTVHAEGNSFWADRLLLMLFGSNAILKQSTPCGMFFEQLLKPFVHFLPVRQDFADVADAVKWARAYDRDVKQIVVNAREFAGTYLTNAAVQTYVDELLTEYAGLLENRDFQIMKGAVRVW